MRSHHYSGNKRYCCACGTQRRITEMRRSTVRSQRWLCMGCAEPPVPVCLVCERPAISNGLCHTHDARWRRWGNPPLEEWVAAFRAERLNACSVCGKTWNGYHGCVHCSPECLAEHKRKASLQHWHARSPESKRAATLRGAASATSRRQADWIEQTCPYCQGRYRAPDWRKTCGKRRCRSRHQTTHTHLFRARQAATALSALKTELEKRHEKEV
jgi:hypothetical protein